MKRTWMDAVIEHAYAVWVFLMTAGVVAVFGEMIYKMTTYNGGAM